jgi:hypothetical protein
MLGVTKVYFHREAIGGNKGGRSYPIPNGCIFAAALAQLAGHELDNHMSFIVKQYGEETAFYWSDNVLIECSRLVAGDSNKEHKVLTLLWEQPAKP